ncbi:NUDIX hydrolase [Georgenia sp. SYP-B2076]|uniref:NUDIX hydrolase n=1 Tax=Georgenia sp. SYP-B2076 TaxID=2495881 RepID=UPI000F8DB3B5|nr:NUDIX hydrolase [Georgenia sp. SYP-B2076]
MTHDAAPSPILAAGGLVVRRVGDADHLVLVHRPKYDDWSFPKGKVDPGEGLADAALREVREETALSCELVASLGQVTYLDETDAPKVAHYWRMAVRDDGVFVPNDEIDGLWWVPLARARTVVDRDADRGLIDALAAQL